MRFLDFQKNSVPFNISKLPIIFAFLWFRRSCSIRKSKDLPISLLNLRNKSEKKAQEREFSKFNKLELIHNQTFLLFVLSGPLTWKWEESKVKMSSIVIIYSYSVFKTWALWEISVIWGFSGENGGKDDEKWIFFEHARESARERHSWKPIFFLK